MKAKPKTKRSQKGPEEVRSTFPGENDEDPTQETMDFAHLNPGYIFEYSSIDQILKYYSNGSESIKQLISKECSMMFECKICKNIYRHLDEFILHKEKFCLQTHTNISNHYEFRTEVENKHININENMINLKNSNSTSQSSKRKPVSKKLSHIVEMLSQKKSQETKQPVKKLPDDQPSNKNNPSSSNLLESSLDKKNSTVENSISDISEDERNGIIGLSSKYIQHFKNLKSLSPYFKENPKKIQIQVRKDYLKNQNPPENASFVPVIKNEDPSKDQETSNISQHITKNVDVKFENDLEQSSIIKERLTFFDNNLPSTSNVTHPLFKSDTQPSPSAKVSSNLQCLTCKRKCKNSNALEKHLSSHRGGPRYRCIDCSYKAYTRLDCLKHAREIHIKSDKKQRASDFIQLIEPGQEYDFLTTDINQNDSQRNISEYSPKARLANSTLSSSLKIELANKLDFEKDMTNLKKKFNKRLVIDPVAAPIEIKSIEETEIKSTEETKIKCESTNSENHQESSSLNNEASSVISSKNLKNKDDKSSRTLTKRKNNNTTQVNERFLKKSKVKQTFKSSLRSKIALRKSLLKTKLLNTNKSLNDFSFINRGSRRSTLRSNVKKSDEAPLTVNNLKNIKNSAKKIKLKSPYMDSAKNKQISHKDKIKMRMQLKSTTKTPVKLKNLQKVQEPSHEFKFNSPNGEENFNFTPSDEDFDIYAEELISHISMFQNMPEFKPLTIKSDKLDTCEKGSSSKNIKFKENKLLQKKKSNKNKITKKKKSSVLKKNIKIRIASKEKRKNKVQITKEIKNENNDSYEIKKKSVPSTKTIDKTKSSLVIAESFSLFPNLNSNENPSPNLLPSTSNFNNFLKPNFKSEINDSIAANEKSPDDIPTTSPINITKTKTPPPSINISNAKTPVELPTKSLYFAKTKTSVNLPTTSVYFAKTKSQPMNCVKYSNVKIPVEIPITSSNIISPAKTTTPSIIITNTKTLVDIPTTSTDNIAKTKTGTTPSFNITNAKSPVDIPSTSSNNITKTKTPVKITKPSIIITKAKTSLDIPTSSSNNIINTKTSLKITPSFIITNAKTPVEITTTSSNNITNPKSPVEIPITSSNIITNSKKQVDIPTTSSINSQRLEEPSINFIKPKDLSINSSKLVPSDSSFNLPRLVILKNKYLTTLKQSKLTPINHSAQKINGSEIEMKKTDSGKSLNTLYYRLEMNKDSGNSTTTNIPSCKLELEKQVSENSNTDISLHSPEIKKEFPKNSSSTNNSLCIPEIKIEESENSSSKEVSGSSSFKEVSEKFSITDTLQSPEIKKEFPEDSSITNISLSKPEIKKDESENSTIKEDSGNCSIKEDSENPSITDTLCSPKIKEEDSKIPSFNDTLSSPEIKEEDSENSSINDTLCSPETKKENSENSFNDISLFRPVRKRVKIHLPDFYYESDMPKAKRNNISSKQNKFRMKKM